MGQFQDFNDEPVLERKYGGHVFKLYLDASHVGISEGRFGVYSSLICQLKHMELLGTKVKKVVSGSPQVR